MQGTQQQIGQVNLVDPQADELETNLVTGKSFANKVSPIPPPKIALFFDIACRPIPIAKWSFGLASAGEI